MSSRRGGNAIRLIAVLALALAALASCEDFFGTVDLKESIRDEVVVATADEVEVTVRPDPDEPGGATSLSTTVQKVGVPFPISVTAFPEYAFTGWSEGGGNDIVRFGAATSASTTAVLTQPGSGVIIQANFTRRPAIEATDPFNFSQNVLKNKRIQLYFSKPMDPATINFQTISITHTPIGSGDPPVSIVGRYQDPTPDAGDLLFTMELVDGQTLEENYLVAVRVSRTVTDATGYAMAADSGISFLVGTSADENPPLWEATNPFAVYRSDGTALGAGNATNSRDVSLRPRAYDVEDRVQYLNLVETQGALNWASQLLYQTAIPYSFQAAGDGSITLTATLEDPSGNDGSASRQVVVTLDTQAPNAPTTVLPPVSPTNSAIGFEVSATDQGLSGIASYRITGGATTTPTSADGSFIGVTPGAEGPNAITVVGVDSAGNIGPELTIPVVYDTQPPTLPTFNTLPATPTNATVSFQVSATDATTSIARYVITAGVVGAPIESADGSFSGIIPAAQGTNSITVRAVDAAGNTGPTGWATVVYDSLGPNQPTIVTPPASPTNAAVDFAVSATDQGVGGVAFYEITGGATTTATSVNGSFSGIVPAAEGMNSITVRAVDTLGNPGATRTITVVYDTQEPDAPTVVTPPVSPTNTAVDFTVTASDQGAAGIASYQITGGATTTPTSVGGSFSGITPDAQGTNAITVRAIDAAGNPGPTATITVVYDTQVPNAPTVITPPVSPTNTAVDFTVSASDQGAAGVASYQIIGGATTTPTSVSGTFSGITPAVQGTNAITVRAIDSAGNVGPTMAISVDYDSLGPNVPTVVTPPVSPTSTGVDFTVFATDRGFAGVVSYQITGGATTTPSSADGSFSGIVPAAQGTNSITVRALDALGNPGATTTVTVDYDSLGPNEPTIVTPPASPTNAAVDFAVSATDQGFGGVAFYEITGGATTTATSVNGSFSGIVPATEGTNSITVRAVDTLGNLGATRTITVVYDTQEPDAPTLVTPPVSPTNTAVAFTVTASDQGAAGIASYQITGGATTTPTSVGGSFSGITPDSQGTNSITVRAIDAAGNPGPTVSISVDYDSLGPDMPTVVTPPVSPTSAPVSFAVSANDQGFAGVASYQITGGATTTPSSADGSFTDLTPAVSGTNTITVIAIDTLGNEGSPVSILVEYNP